MRKFPWYGAQQVWTFVKLRGHVLPVVASDDQYCVRFPDGTMVWVEKWDCEPAFPIPYTRDTDEMKRQAKQQASRNVASSSREIDLAFELNAGKFED